MIGRTVSHYKIIEELGRGGMGVVYKALDTRLERTVALKFPSSHLLGSDEKKKRFIHEAQAEAALSHPNICTVYEIDEFEDRPFIVMEYIEGESLRSMIESGPVGLEKIIETGMQIVAGLQEANEKGIIHRDIKPSNIMITNRNNAKIMDFGLAKLSGHSSFTKECTTIGTISYISPEQARSSDVDHRTDIWSVGVILYEMITGRRPFEGDYEQATIYSILNKDPKPPTALRTDVPTELERIILKCLEKDARERYQSPKELSADLFHLKKKISPDGSLREPSSRPRAGRRIGRWVFWISFAAAAVATASVMVPRLFGPSVQRGGIPAVDRPKRLAVLPFENLGSQEDEYFADGITEEITARLASVNSLNVIARTSSMQYKGTDKDIKKIGEELKVDYILEGTIRWQPLPGKRSQVRVTPQLIRVSDEIHLWAHIYQEDLADIFEVQSKIAVHVAEALNLSLLEPERRAIETKPTDNLEAYQAYLKGLEYWLAPTRKKSDFGWAVEMFERSPVLDPQLAQSHAYLSIIHSCWYHEKYDRSPEQLARIRKATDRALELNPDIPESQLALGYYYYYGLADFDRALDVFMRALEKFPNNSDLLHAVGLVHRRLGNFEASAEYFERGLNIDPRYALISLSLDELYCFLRDYEKAVYYGNHAISLAPDQSVCYESLAYTYWIWNGDLEKSKGVMDRIPSAVGSYSNIYYRFLQEIFERDYDGAFDVISGATREVCEDELLYLPKPLMRAYVYDLRGEPDKAIEYYESARKLLEEKVAEDPDDARFRMSLAFVYAGIGRKEDAVREGESGIKLCPVKEDAVAGQSFLEDLARIYTRAGEYDRAFDQIDHLLSIPSMFSVTMLKIDPRFDPLRETPRYAEIVDKYSGDSN